MKSYDILRTARLLVVAVAVLVTQALAMPQTNSFVAEASIDAIPLDLEVTPNGKVAVVRGTSLATRAAATRRSASGAPTPVPRSCRPVRPSSAGAT